MQEQACKLYTYESAREARRKIENLIVKVIFKSWGNFYVRILYAIALRYFFYMIPINIA